MDTEPKTSKTFDWAGWLCVSVVFVILAALILPPFLRAQKLANQSITINNLRRIGLGLYEFEQKYGAFPNEETKFEFDKGYIKKIYVGGKSSNALFRQLLTSSVALEEVFYAPIPTIQVPDGNITKGKAIEPGENGFSYITNLSSKDDPLTPIVLTPLIPGTTKFDPKPFDGKAIILHIDNSVRSYDIAKDGHIYDAKGINLLSPKHPIWKGKAPDIRYPEL